MPSNRAKYKDFVDGTGLPEEDLDEGLQEYPSNYRDRVRADVVGNGHANVTRPYVILPPSWGVSDTGGLAVTVKSGIGYCEGQRIGKAGDTMVAGIPSNTTDYKIYVSVSNTAAYDTDLKAWPAVFSGTAGALPSGGHLIAIVTTDEHQVTKIKDYRSQINTQYWGTLVRRVVNMTAARHSLSLVVSRMADRIRAMFGFKTLAEAYFGFPYETEWWSSLDNLVTDYPQIPNLWKTLTGVNKAFDNTANTGYISDPYGDLPAFTSAGGGSISDGTYYAVYTWTNDIGETGWSTEASNTVSASNAGTLTLTAGLSIPTGANDIRCYVGTTSGGPYFLQGSATNTNTVSFTAFVNTTTTAPDFPLLLADPPDALPSGGTTPDATYDRDDGIVGALQRSPSMKSRRRDLKWGVLTAGTYRIVYTLVLRKPDGSIGETLPSPPTTITLTDEDVIRPTNFVVALPVRLWELENPETADEEFDLYKFKEAHVYMEKDGDVYGYKRANFQLLRNPVGTVWQTQATVRFRSDNETVLGADRSTSRTPVDALGKRVTRTLRHNDLPFPQSYIYNELEDQTFSNAGLIRTLPPDDATAINPPTNNTTYLNSTAKIFSHAHDATRKEELRGTFVRAEDVTVTPNTPTGNLYGTDVQTGLRGINRRYLNTRGDTVTGGLYVPAPSDRLHACTKTYADDYASFQTDPSQFYSKALPAGVEFAGGDEQLLFEGTVTTKGGLVMIRSDSGFSQSGILTNARHNFYYHGDGTTVKEFRRKDPRREVPVGADMPIETWRKIALIVWHVFRNGTLARTVVHSFHSHPFDFSHVPGLGVAASYYPFDGIPTRGDHLGPLAYKGDAFFRWGRRTTNRSRNYQERIGPVWVADVYAGDGLRYVLYAPPLKVMDNAILGVPGTYTYKVVAAAIQGATGAGSGFRSIKTQTTPGDLQIVEFR